MRRNSLFHGHSLSKLVVKSCQQHKTQRALVKPPTERTFRKRNSRVKFYAPLTVFAVFPPPSASPPPLPSSPFRALRPRKSRISSWGTDLVRMSVEKYTKASVTTCIYTYYILQSSIGCPNLKIWIGAGKGQSKAYVKMFMSPGLHLGIKEYGI